MKELVKEVTEEFNNNKSLISKNLKFNVKHDKPNGYQANIFGIKSRLEQVLANLIDNAISFSPENGNITISVKSTNEFVSLVIKDEGPGFKEIKTERIFKRFYSNRPEKFGEHSGLGLNIVKNIIEMHDGKIIASNRTDKPHGAKVEIIIPINS